MSQTPMPPPVPSTPTPPCRTLRGAALPARSHAGRPSSKPSFPLIFPNFFPFSWHFHPQPFGVCIQPAITVDKLLRHSVDTGSFQLGVGLGLPGIGRVLAAVGAARAERNAKQRRQCRGSVLLYGIPANGGHQEGIGAARWKLAGELPKLGKPCRHGPPIQQRGTGWQGAPPASPQLSLEVVPPRSSQLAVRGHARTRWQGGAPLFLRCLPARLQPLRAPRAAPRPPLWWLLAVQNEPPQLAHQGINVGPRPPPPPLRLPPQRARRGPKPAAPHDRLQGGWGAGGPQGGGRLARGAGPNAHTSGVQASN